VSYPASVVIPLLRQNDRWLEQAIRSALGQTTWCEVLVVPSPHTPTANLAIVEELRAAAPDRLIVASPPVGGFPCAVNTGVRLARAERVGLLLSDDWLEPTAVEECLKIEADVVSTGLRSVASDGSDLPHLGRPLDLDCFLGLSTPERRAAYLTHFLLFRRSTIDSVGGLDETLGDAPGIDDYDLIWVLLEHGATVGITPRPLYNYRVHGGDRLTLRNPEEQARTLSRILDKHGVEGPEKARLIEKQGVWLGRSEDIVHAERAAASGGAFTRGDDP
jgi:GT2 family glycosyltransferase